MAQGPPTVGTQTVESDLYDRAAIRRLRAGSLSWQKLGEEGSRLVPHFESLLDDLFCALFKYNVVMVPASAPSASLSRAVVVEVMGGRAYEALRQETLLDEMRSGLATVSIGEQLLAALREERTLNRGDLLDLWSLSEDERREREAAEEASVAEDLLANMSEGEAETAEVDGEESPPDDADSNEEEEGSFEVVPVGEAGSAGEEEGIAPEGSAIDIDEAEGEVGDEEPEAPGDSGDAEGAGGEPSSSSQSARISAMREAAEKAKRMARVAEAQRRQKQRRVEEGLERVGSRLEKDVLGAAADAALKVQDLPEALSSWGHGLGAGGELDAGQRIDLGRRLADNPKLKKLAKVFGRMRDNALAVRKRVFDRADEELFEVERHRSLDDIARLVPHELVALSHPVLRQDFYRRLLDGGLLTYSLRGVDSRGHGPMVICLDTSSSMAGDKEIWSKAVTLTFVEIARRQRRRCHVVCFADASALKEFELNPGNSWQVALEETLNLAEHFSGGGTDFMAPLDAAVAKISSRELKKADVVLITDGECAVDEEWRQEFELAKKRRNFSVYAILIDRGSVRGETVEQLADRISRISELTDDGREIFSREDGRGGD